MSSIRVGIDVGGTFTDFVFVRNDNEVINLKVPSTPSDPAAAILEGLKKVLGEGDQVVHLAQGTTLAVNTLIQRNGARTGMLVTRGFRDLLEIGRQRLTDPNNYAFAKAAPLVARKDVREINERLDARGDVLEPLDEAGLIAAVQGLVDEGVEALAICFMHSYRSDRHEKQAAEIVRRKFPGVYVCTSSEVWPEQREYERSLVTVINAYVGPRMDQYFGQLEEYTQSLGIKAPVLSTKSNGGVMTARAARVTPVETLLSGPASGVIGANHIGQMTGITKLIGLDMGGTTAEVAIIDGEVLYSTESQIGDFPLVTPAVDVSSIGAGGGSVAWVDDFGILKVGPKSAGAMPGPACYGRGGTEPTITDAYLVSGILHAGDFTGGLSLNLGLAEKAIKTVADKLGLSLKETASAILQVATANMYAQLMLVLARKGVDHADFALLAYGGAGPTHALFLAREAGIKKVLVPPSPGTVCALGALVADIRSDFVETVYRNTNELEPKFVEDAFRALDARGREWLSEQSSQTESVRAIRAADMRYKGQSFNLTVQVPDELGDSLEPMRESFHQAYEKIYGYADRDAPVELINLRFTIAGILPTPDIAPALRAGEPGVPSARRQVTFAGVTHDTAVYTGSDLVSGQRIEGPAVVEAMGTTIVVPQGYFGTMLASGAMLIEELA